jgi:hypothetical protein
MAEPRKYGPPTGDPSLGFESTRDLETIVQHIGKHWGKVDRVFHEIVSEYVHIDLHLIRATPERPYHFLITSGMSDRPMTVPQGKEECGYAELVIALPSTWPLNEEGCKDERNYWPLRLLRRLARFPHLYRTWLWYRHTLANYDPPEPYTPDIAFCASILSKPTLCEQDALRLQVSPEKRIRFFSLIPLYEEELRFAWQHSSDALFERLDAIGVNELLCIDRPNVCTNA